MNLAHRGILVLGWCSISQDQKVPRPATLSTLVAVPLGCPHMPCRPRDVSRCHQRLQCPKHIIPCLLLRQYSTSSTVEHGFLHLRTSQQRQGHLSSTTTTSSTRPSHHDQACCSNIASPTLPPTRNIFLTTIDDRHPCCSSTHLRHGSADCTCSR